jgi:predicted deacylase
MAPATVTSLDVAAFDPQQTPAGSKMRWHLIVDYAPDGQPVVLPVLVARGASTTSTPSGKTLLATGVVHGDEFEGAVAIQDLFEALQPEQMSGTFIGVPVVNGPAFTAGTRTGGYDQQNLARVFPGSADGTPSERIAHALTEHIIPHADLYADLHSAGNAYRLKQFSGYQLNELVVPQRAAATAFGLEVVWGTPPLPGRSLSSAADQHVPAIYVELEGEGRCRPANRDVAQQGLQNLLAYLGIAPGEFPSAEPRFLVEDEREQAGHLQVENLAPTGGLFLPTVAIWDRVAVGDQLGSVRHADGRTLAEVRTRKAGRVLMLRTFPRVFSGDTLGSVLETGE